MSNVIQLQKTKPPGSLSVERSEVAGFVAMLVASGDGQTASLYLTRAVAESLCTTLRQILDDHKREGA